MNARAILGIVLGLAAVCGLVTEAPAGQRAGRSEPGLRAIVEIEEEVYRYEPANNGAGPMWCSGSTCLVRIGEKVFAGGLETLKGAKPLNNCRWTLLGRRETGWVPEQADSKGRTREPCPLACFHDGRLFLSANPTLTGPSARAGPARPQILQFSTTDPKAPFQMILPKWQGKPAFTEHSYRSFAADGRRGEMILFQNVGYTHVEWAFSDSQGQWIAQGKLKWPWGAEYDKPQPIRVCYPNVALRDRAVYFCGVSDIIEPYGKWREHKRKLTGRSWDYDFRRLFFTWSDDIITGKFNGWIEIASRDKTCGWISPCDLWAAPDGLVHLLWTERAIDTRLRKEFFPDAKQSQALNYAVVRQGKVIRRRSLAVAGEGLSGEIPGGGRFHVTPDNRLLVFHYVSGTDRAGKRVSENRLLEITSGGRPTPAVRAALKHPFTSFFTATIRAGSKPSRTLDLLGQCVGRPHAIRYARISLKP